VLASKRAEPRVPPAEEAIRIALSRIGGYGLNARWRDRRFPVALSPDNRWLVIGGKDRTAQLWDLEATPLGTGATILHDDAEVVSATFSPDSRWLVTGGWRPFANGSNPRDPTLNFSDFLKEVRDRRLWLAIGGISPFPGGWTPEETGQKTLRLWDLTAPDPSASKMILHGHETRIDALAISFDSRWLVTGSWDKTARLWDLKTKKSSVNWHSSAWTRRRAPRRRNFSKQPLAGYGEHHRTARIWDLTKPDPSASSVLLPKHEGTVNLLAISADSRRLVTAGRGVDQPLDPAGATPRLWDLSAGDIAASVVVLEYLERTNDEITFSPDGRWLAAWGEWAYATLTDLQAPDPANSCFTIPTGDGPVRVVTFSSDSSRLATACGYWPDEQALATDAQPEFVARVWNLTEKLSASPIDQDGRRLMLLDTDSSMVLEGHQDVILDAVFAMDNQWLITSSADNRVCVWGISSDTRSNPSSTFASTRMGFSRSRSAGTISG
jgi:WD40 repeat protein